MISLKARVEAVKLTMIEVASDGPVGYDDIVSWFQDQAVQIKDEDAWIVAHWAIGFLFDRKMIQRYDDMMAFIVDDSLVDLNGRYMQGVVDNVLEDMSNGG